MLKFAKFFVVLTFFLISQPLEIEGLKAISESELRPYLPVVFDEKNIAESIKLLAKTGYFDRIEYYYDNKKGLFKLKLQEADLIYRVTLKGADKLSSEDQQSIISKYTRKRFSQETKDALRKELQSAFDKKGYPYADVNFSREGSILVAEVIRGPRIKIESVEIQYSEAEGAPKALLKRVKEVISTTRHRWWLSWLTGEGYLSKEILEKDRSAVVELLKLFGYFDGNCEATFNQIDKKAKVVFNVFLGDRYKFGEILWEGEKELPFQSAEPFDGKKVKDFVEKLSLEFKDQGYAFVNVIPEIRLDKEKKLVNLRLRVEKGNQYKLGRVKFEGNQNTRDYVLRRELRVTEGEQFSQTKLERTKTRLLRTGLFESVNFEVFPSKISEEFADVNFKVKETQTGSLSVSAGYSTLDNLFTRLRASEQNFLGTGIGVSLDLSLGREFDAFDFRVSERRLFNTFTSGSLNAFRLRRDFDDFKLYQTGGRVSFGYDFEGLGIDWTKDFSVRLIFDSREVKVDSIKDEAAKLIKTFKGKNWVNSVGVEVKRTTLDRLIRPTKGSFQTLLLEHSLGGDLKYRTVSFKNSLYRPVFVFGDEEEKVVVFNLRTSVDLGKGIDGPYPLHKRYFPGGSKTVRGYKPRSMGPREGESEYGGAKQLINNAEIFVPISEEAKLDFNVFFDIGEAFDDDKTIKLDDLRSAYGAGIKWFSPIGPIGLDIGFPLDKRAGDDDFVINFSLGAEF